MKIPKKLSTIGTIVLIGVVCIIGVLSFLKIQNASNNSIREQVPTTEQVLTNVQISQEVLDGLQLSDKQGELLKTFVYYKGTVTINEDQNWTSKGLDRSSAQGSAKLVSTEILIYDIKTDSSYILARQLGYESQHLVAVNDIQGSYLGQSQVNGFGQMTEYYGLGLLMKKPTALRSVSTDPDFEINFTMNPLRIDTTNGSLYNYPLPNKADWVTYTSNTETTRLGSAKLWTPEIVRSQPLNLIPELLEYTDVRNYSSKVSATYSAPDRLFKPSGSISYQYKNVTMSEALSAVLSMKEQSEFISAYENRIGNQPEPWLQVAQLVDQWVVIEDASSTLERILVSVSPQNIKKADSALATLDLITNNDILQEQIDRLNHSLDGINGSQGVLNQLKSTVEALDSSGVDVEQQQAKANFTKAYGLVEEIMLAYTKIFEALNVDVDQLRELSGMSTKIDEVTVERYYIDGQEQLKKLNDLDQQIYTLISIFDGSLYDLEQKTTSTQKEQYHAISKVFFDWEETLMNGDQGQTMSLDLPEGFPAELNFMLEDAVIALSGTVPGDAGKMDGFAVTYKLELSVDEMAAIYKKQLNTREQLIITRVGNLTKMTFLLSPFEATVLIMPNSMGGAEKTMVQIVLKAFQ